MPQINPDPRSLVYRRFHDIERRLHAMEATPSIETGSDYTPCPPGTPIATNSRTWQLDPTTTVTDLACFGAPGSGSKVQVTASCLISLPVTPGWLVAGLVGVCVDSGTAYDPTSGPGFYSLALLGNAGGNLQVTTTGARTITVVDAGHAQGLSTHSFEMAVMSYYGQMLTFGTRSMICRPTTED
jgi:hypothetical protein